MAKKEYKTKCDLVGNMIYMEIVKEIKICAYWQMD